MKGGNPVVMLDRRRLAAPLFAQAGAFVVVLIIGGFTGHSSSGSTAGHGAAPSASAAVRPTATASVPTDAGAGSKLTVKVSGVAASVGAVAGSKVSVLKTGTLSSVAAGQLNSRLEYTATVPPGAYQVCLSPPAEWRDLVPGTSALDGWICRSVQVHAAPQQVTFALTPGSGV
jgi:hypothetical protein